ncbi:RNA 2',3'-cyclic phosphodiesterase [Salininema proteolyticum]|uniref:RNA 2',3'-cyclic phosphodiesterase n=1 Tax=Salininema proteolyticum TaxID=1607685 RepID=A0ABV8TV94_9ACTN
MEAGERLFVALDLPPVVKDGLAAARSRSGLTRVGDAVRLVDPGQWHVTLVFLGWVPVGSRGEVVASLESVCAGVSGLDLVLAGGGRLGSARGGVVYAGLAGDVERLGRLVRALRRSLRRVGLEVERRRFFPHVTVARVRGRVDLSREVERLGEFAGSAWRAEEAVLYRSRLSGEGAEYSVVARVPFAG